ncbi:MAG: S-layer homology domain-containing protein [Clostridia bacterium]|nr:S-layer homology domain-containing protein [Clostridia bacterium]
MSKNKIFALLLAAAMTASVSPAVYADNDSDGISEHYGSLSEEVSFETAEEAAENDEINLMSADGEALFVDRNRMSDEEFFGKWNMESSEWETEPKFDYSYNADMELVGDYVKQGDYKNAKDCLLYYYQDRDLSPGLPTGRTALEARISMENIHTFESPVVGILSVKKTPAQYSVNVTSLVKSNVSCFLIHSVKRESEEKNKEEIVSFNSKEAGSNAPVLEIQQGNKVTNIPVEQDMYIRGGDFSGENYGKEDVILVSEGGAAPNDNGTRQAHIKFDISSLDTGAQITRATLKLYGSSTAENKEVAVFSGVESQWDENIITYSNMPIRVASWNNTKDGYDWKQRSGLHAQFYNVQVRLNHIPRMFSEYYATNDERYAVAAIKQTLDFIGDNGGLLYDLYTKEAALNAAFRGDPQLPLIFTGALSCKGIITGDAFTSILKLIWQDATGLTYAKNEWRKHNGQAFQINSLLRYIAYFPEFADRNSWVGNIDRRVMELSEDLLNEDGGYTEPTSGYDSGVLGTFTGLFTLANVANIELPEEFREIYEKFAMAEMNLTMPDGVQWGWGDGGPSQMRKRIYDVAEITGNPYMFYFGTLDSEDRKGTIPDWTSYFLPVSRLGVMRDNWGDNAVAAFLRGRTGLSHSHADVNQMLLYAYGRYLLADTGMNSYDARDPYYDWQSKRTESHNTVEINEKGQQKSGNVFTTMYTNPRMDFYSAESHAYEDFTHTRKVAFAKNDKFFIVSDFIKAPDDGSVNTYNQAWHNLVEAKPSIDDETKIAQTNYASGANLEIVPVNPEALTSATLDDGVGLNESNSIRNTSKKKHVSYKIKTAGNAMMNTIIYPFESSVTANIKTMPEPVSDNADRSAAAFSMELPDGTKAEYYVNFRPEKPRRFDWYDVDAENVFMKYNQSDTLEFFSASNINYIKQNGKEFMRSSEKLTDISVSYEGRVANIQTTTDIDLDKEYIIMYAPDVSKAAVNDKSVSFIRTGECVIIGNYREEFNASSDSDGNTYADVENDIVVTYPITVSGEKKWVDLTIFKGTRLMVNGKWDGVIRFDTVISGGASAGNQSFGTIPLDEIATSRPICVSFPFANGRIAFQSEGELIRSETELDKNTIEEASDKSTALKPVFFDNGTESFVYLYNLRNIMLYSDSSNTGNNSETGKGHGSGSGGGGGGHIWPKPAEQPGNNSENDGENDGENDTDKTDTDSNTTVKNSFNDIKEHWAKDSIEEMHSLGFVNGRNDQLFDPDGDITRAEFVAIVVRMLGIDTSEAVNVFEDVPETAWYYSYVNAAASAGIVKGSLNGFEPEKLISRGEMAKVLMETCKFADVEYDENTARPDFTDSDKFSEWEKEAIDYVSGAGLIKGMPDGRYANANRATRAEAVTVLNRIYHLMDKGEYDEHN